MEAAAAFMCVAKEVLAAATMAAVAARGDGDGVGDGGDGAMVVAMAAAAMMLMAVVASMVVPVLCEGGAGTVDHTTVRMTTTS